jgi:hypothetical protein
MGTMGTMGTSECLQAFCAFPRQKREWEQWEQKPEICSHSDGNGNKSERDGNAAFVERVSGYGFRSQNSQCSHKKQVRLYLQNAFIAELLAKPTPIPLAELLDAPAVDPLTNENIEMHDSALFDVVVDVDFYDGRRIRIPQTSTPAGWESPF